MCVYYKADILGLYPILAHAGQQALQAAFLHLVRHVAGIDEDVGTIAAQHIGKDIGVAVIALALP
jgi:hypothetical protein